ncbi:MAG: hypothetical protein PVH68_12905 [Armatimonadota bacterium]
MIVIAYCIALAGGGGRIVFVAAAAVAFPGWRGAGRPVRDGPHGISTHAHWRISAEQTVD